MLFYQRKLIVVLTVFICDVNIFLQLFNLLVINAIIKENNNIFVTKIISEGILFSYISILMCNVITVVLMKNNFRKL